jgi:hypothetical protein
LHFKIKNAKIYHYLFYRILSAIEQREEVNPLKFYFDEFCRDGNLKDKINVWAIGAVSAESGTDVPQEGIWKSTALNTNF